MPDVKLLLLGNGRVGKTQLCRQLRGEVYDETVPSTHGVLVTSAPDDTQEGRDRAAIVDRLCAEAKTRGITILRDKDVMGLGERISKFMQRIGRAERIFTVLSDKYLKSPFCMFELSGVWRNSRLEGEEFLKRVKVYTFAVCEDMDTGGSTRVRHILARTL